MPIVPLATAVPAVRAGREQAGARAVLRAECSLGPSGQGL